jgi:hypothetical protein
LISRLDPATFPFGISGVAEAVPRFFYYFRASSSKEGGALIISINMVFIVNALD